MTFLKHLKTVFVSVYIVFCWWKKNSVVVITNVEKNILEVFSKVDFKTIGYYKCFMYLHIFLDHFGWHNPNFWKTPKYDTNLFNLLRIEHVIYTMSPLSFSKTISHKTLLDITREIIHTKAIIELSFSYL